MPKVHKRHITLTKAKNEMAQLIDDLVEKYDLSASEVLNVLAEKLNQITSSCVVAEREENDK